MYEGDYQEFYYEMLDKFPWFQKKGGVQHSELRGALSVHLYEGFGATEEEAVELLKWAGKDPSFVFARIEEEPGQRTWSFIFTDNENSDELRAFMTYLLPVGQNMPDEVEDLSRRLFLRRGASFSTRSRDSIPEDKHSPKSLPENKVSTPPWVGC